MNKTKITEQQVAEWCAKITTEVYLGGVDEQTLIDGSHTMPIAILAPVRGGLTPAVYLSHMLEIPMFPMNYSLRDHHSDLEIPTSFYHYVLNHKGNTVLLVDDIVDTGATFKGILAEFEEFDGVNLKTAALLHNTDQEVPVDFAGKRFKRSEDATWFEFFWEK